MLSEKASTTSTTTTTTYTRITSTTTTIYTSTNSNGIITTTTTSFEYLLQRVSPKLRSAITRHPHLHQVDRKYFGKKLKGADLKMFDLYKDQKAKKILKDDGVEKFKYMEGLDPPGLKNFP